MRLVFVAFVLLWPLTAAADPLTVTIGTLVIKGAVVAQILLTVGTMVYGAAQQRKAERRAKAAERAQRDAYNAGLKDRTITQIATEAPYTYIYGRARVGSAVVGVFTSGNKDQYKHLVCIHAAHECDGFEDIYIAGKKLAALDANGWVTAAPFAKTETLSARESKTGSTFNLAHTPAAGTLRVIGYYRTSGDGIGQRPFPYTLSGKAVTVLFPDEATSENVTCSYQYMTFTPYVNVKMHLGGIADPADAYLMSVTGGKWKSTAVLRGFCYTVVTLDLNEAEFQGGIPSIEVVLRGKRLFDPRTEITAWSQNPTLAIRDYLTSEICGVGEDELPEDDFITAANVCDELQTFGARYTFNGTVSSDQTQSTVLERMAQAMAGGLVSTTWSVYAGKYVAPVMALDQGDIVGSLAITPGISDADLYNGVKGQYVSNENNYVATDFKPFQNPAYQAVDGRDLWSDIDFPFTDTVQRVWNLCRIFVEDQRNGYTVKADFKLKAWPLRVGQRVTLSSRVFGWDNKVFRVTDKKFSPAGAVTLTLKEDDESIWDLADAVVPDSTPNTGLSDPFDIDELMSVTCQSGADQLIAKDGTVISRILVTWPVTTTQAVFTRGTIEVQWRKNDSDVWNQVVLSGSSTQTYLTPVEDGAFYVVRGRAVNPYLNVVSDWTYAELHQVVGKTAPPANIEGLSISGTVLSWEPNSELDLKGYVFRFHYGNNLDWNSAPPLHEGVITQSPFDLVTRPAGVVTIMGKAIDTSGNVSVKTANIVTNLGDPLIANIVETVDFAAAAFPGDWVSCSLDGDGKLVADATDSFYGTDNQSAYGLDEDSFYKESAYQQMMYITPEVGTSAALAGSLLTLSLEYQGTDLYIEYRLAGPGSAYGVDADSAYGLDDEPFYNSPPGAWMPWPGQIIAANDVYQWRITIGAGSTRGMISALSVTIDAPDIVEYLEDIAVGAAGTVVPYTKPFRVIKTVTPTLQANDSGAETVEVNKSTNLAPVLHAYDAAHTSVSGATADVILKGY